MLREKNIVAATLLLLPMTTTDGVDVNVREWDPHLRKLNFWDYSKSSCPYRWTTINVFQDGDEFHGQVDWVDEDKDCKTMSKDWNSVFTLVRESR